MREKLEIGNEKNDDYNARCYGCGSNIGVEMRALRSKDRRGICGWLFVCQNCIELDPQMYMERQQESALETINVLQQCPFCGGDCELHLDKILTSNGHKQVFEFYCEGCGISTQSYIDLFCAIQAWNRRLEDFQQKE